VSLSKSLFVGPVLDGSHSDDVEILRDPAAAVAEVAVDALEAILVVDALVGCSLVGNRCLNASRMTSASLVHFCSCNAVLANRATTTHYETH
jgi:hypothetical protein